MAELTPAQERQEEKKKSHFWKEELRLSGKRCETWFKNGASIKAEFKAQKEGLADDHNSFLSGSKSKFPIFYSNTQTLHPALYSRLPNPEVERSFKDADAVGRLAAEVWERGIDYAIRAFDFNAVVNYSVLDYLLVARGVDRVVYTSEVEDYTDENGTPQKRKVKERAFIKHINYKDFRHGEGRTWDEVTWVAFRAYVTKDKAAKRFGEEIAEQLDYSMTRERSEDDTRREDTDHISEAFKKAQVWEVWDKDTKEVSWVAKGYDGLLDRKPDPLGLEGFFPCPKPLFGLLDGEDLLPTPDFIYYAELARQLDIINSRIALLTRACRVLGIYDASNASLAKLVLEGDENELMPVANFGAIAAQGGLQGAIEWFPIDQVAGVLVKLYEAKAQLIQDIYEITGISDIVRGVSDSSETATAQQMKGRFAVLRLGNRQAQVQEYIRDLISLMGEVLVEHFEPQELRLMSGYDYMPDANPYQLDEQGQPVRDANGAPMSSGEWEQIVGLLKSEKLRTFRINIETDSTIAVDEQAEKQGASEYLEAVSNSIANFAGVAQTYPVLAPYFKATLLMVARKFKAGREVESTLESSFGQFEQQLLAPQEEGPDPEMLKIQNEQQRGAQKAQLDKYKVDTDAQVERYKADLNAQTELQKAQIELERVRAELQLEAMKISQQGDIEAAKAVADARQPQERSTAPDINVNVL